MSIRSLLALVASALLAPCTALAQGSAPSDAQIAAIVVTANQVDIDAGRLAKARAHSQAVKDFAERMIVDHSSVNQSAVALVHRLHVAPENSPTSESLKAGGEQNLARLRGLSGSAFDAAYIDHEVAYHQSVLDAVDHVLIPSAKNEELKALLIKVRPAFVAHLEHAKQLQGSLKAHAVVIDQLRFVPAVLVVRRGDRIIWLNHDLVPHTVTATSNQFDSHTIAAQGVWSYRARKRGQYDYRCSFHPAMKGKLIVQ